MVHQMNESMKNILDKIDEVSGYLEKASATTTNKDGLKVKPDKETVQMYASILQELYDVYTVMLTDEQDKQLWGYPMSRMLETS